jgi:5-carboxymethyl-2-hydroxymuconate isomerase
LGPPLLSPEIGYDMPWQRWTPALPKPTPAYVACPSLRVKTGGDTETQREVEEKLLKTLTARHICSLW